jgi:flagellar capping protein FliD
VASKKPNNSEMSGFESILDNEMKSLEGSALWENVHSEYEYLDEYISELKKQIDELEEENDDLKEQVEDLERSNAND